MAGGFVKKQVDYDGQRVNLSIWDTAGSELFRTIIPIYFRGAKGLFIVFSLKSEAQFDEVPEWLALVEQDIPIECRLMLVGTHADCKDKDRQVSNEHI